MPSEPDHTTDFEEERILAALLGNSDSLYSAPFAKDKLNNPSVKRQLISTEGWDAEIVGDEVQMRFAFASEDPEDEDYQPILFLPRKEVAYAMEKWLAFLQRDIDPNYSEIIDTKEAYR
ncbi:DUF5376 family protein [Eikenella sp. Marseille-P7795]|uniref:DUF5376 family protein n=1 Tax=Eikenella sp. Marseille-P7795 TaxID=2866577 RepID=UPI001CE40E44